MSSVVPTIVKILKSNQDSSIVISAMNAFGKIAIGNIETIDTMLDLLSSSNNTTEIKESIINNLAKVANGNKKTIYLLISTMNSTQDLIKIRKLAANSLGQIAVGDQDTIAAMTKLLTAKLSNSFKDCIATNINKIDPDNLAVAEYKKTRKQDLQQNSKIN